MEIAVNFQIKNKKISLTAVYFTKSAKTQIISKDRCFLIERKILIVSSS